MPGRRWVTAWSPRQAGGRDCTVERFEVDADAAKRRRRAGGDAGGWWPVARTQGPGRTVEAIDDDPRPAGKGIDMLASGGRAAAGEEPLSAPSIDPALVEEALRGTRRGGCDVEPAR